ncbi:MAG: ATP-binding protein [Rudaea sp.]
MTTPILLSWSGGKDSALALQRLRNDPDWRVVGLLTAITREYDRISIHGVRRSILHAQANSLGLALIEATIPPKASNEIYEAAFARALDQASEYTPGLNTIAFGDLYLADVRAYRERLIETRNWKARFPLWGEDTSMLARRFIESGFRAILCCVDTQQLDAGFCGLEFDADLLARLPASCDPCGENGEFHTCVYAGPILREAVHLQRADRVLRDDRFEYVDLKLL